MAEHASVVSQPTLDPSGDNVGTGTPTQLRRRSTRTNSAGELVSAVDYFPKQPRSAQLLLQQELFPLKKRRSRSRSRKKSSTSSKAADPDNRGSSRSRAGKAGRTRSSSTSKERSGSRKLCERATTSTFNDKNEVKKAKRREEGAESEVEQSARSETEYNVSSDGTDEQTDSEAEHETRYPVKSKAAQRSQSGGPGKRNPSERSPRRTSSRPSSSSEVVPQASKRKGRIVSVPSLSAKALEEHKLNQSDSERESVDDTEESDLYSEGGNYSDDADEDDHEDTDDENELNPHPYPVRVLDQAHIRSFPIRTVAPSVVQHELDTRGLIVLEGDETSRALAKVLKAEADRLWADKEAKKGNGRIFVDGFRLIPSRRTIFGLPLGTELQKNAPKSLDELVAREAATAQQCNLEIKSKDVHENASLHGVGGSDNLTQAHSWEENEPSQEQRENNVFFPSIEYACRYLLGPDFQCKPVKCVYAVPSVTQMQTPHRDTIAVEINCFLFLTDVGPETGAPVFFPCSHDIRLKQQTPELYELKVGDMVLFNSTLGHYGTATRTPRPMAFLSYRPKARLRKRKLLWEEEFEKSHLERLLHPAGESGNGAKQSSGDAKMIDVAELNERYYRYAHQAYHAKEYSRVQKRLRLAALAASEPSGAASVKSDHMTEEHESDVAKRLEPRSTRKTSVLRHHRPDLNPKYFNLDYYDTDAETDEIRAMRMRVLALDNGLLYDENDPRFPLIFKNNEGDGGYAEIYP